MRISDQALELGPEALRFQKKSMDSVLKANRKRSQSSQKSHRNSTDVPSSSQLSNLLYSTSKSKAMNPDSSLTDNVVASHSPSSKDAATTNHNVFRKRGLAMQAHMRNNSGDSAEGSSATSHESRKSVKSCSGPAGRNFWIGGAVSPGILSDLGQQRILKPHRSPTGTPVPSPRVSRTRRGRKSIGVVGWSKGTDGTKLNAMVRDQKSGYPTAVCPRGDFYCDFSGAIYNLWKERTFNMIRAHHMREEFRKQRKKNKLRRKSYTTDFQQGSKLLLDMVQQRHTITGPVHRRGRCASMEIKRRIRRSSTLNSNESMLKSKVRPCGVRTVNDLTIPIPTINSAVRARATSISNVSNRGTKDISEKIDENPGQQEVCPNSAPALMSAS
ncbi:hypothetical protein AAMO2058_001356800 [Amorphochlora amoebiformis]